ncbi:glycosyltransferase family A protein [Novipirellula caenicola]|uniref:Glycosyltransferase 2-like domain-containing protein n=1 Tax=Novipirellula caenicola TaxID=1536901 RepID=A0ABP9W1R1_9BACT
MLTSVVIPLFNKADYIEATLQSAVSQFSEPFGSKEEPSTSAIEVLVVDNGSTDGGPAIVEKFARQHPQVSLLSSPGRGPGHARNFGVSKAVGDWIQFLDADDLLEENHLATLIHEAIKYPSANVIAGGWKEFVDGVPDEFVEKRPASEQDSSKIADATIAASPWAVHAAIVRRDLVLANPWPEHLDGWLAEDNAFWFRICLYGKVAFSDTATALYRTQTENCRTKSDDVQQWYEGVNAAAEENVKTLGESGREPNAVQSSNLMRLYSGLYSQAVAAGNREYAEMAAARANFWLCRCKSSSCSLSLRKILGIQLFEKMRRLINY